MMPGFNAWPVYTRETPTQAFVDPATGRALQIAAEALKASVRAMEGPGARAEALEQAQAALREVESVHGQI